MSAHTRKYVLSEPIPHAVFLGGVCGKTEWRDRIAIPMLEAAGITYYNPQISVGQWQEEMIAIEAEAKERARHILVVITGETRASASIQEATEHALRGRRNLSLVIDNIPPGTVVEGVEVVGADLKDANRARAYLRSVIRRLRPDMVIHPTVEAAVEAIIDVELGQRVDRARDAIRQAVASLTRAGATATSPQDKLAMATTVGELIALFPAYFEHCDDEWSRD